MNNISLNLKEQKILWCILNQAQDIGLKNIGQLIEKYRTIDNKDDFDLKALNDWINQTQEEYDIINLLKVKLCGDLDE